MATSEIDFTALYSRHLDFVWRNLRAMGVPAADLEDATQDTFVVAYRRQEDFRPQASMRAWLYGIARRVAYRQRRGGGRRARLADAVSAEPRERPSLEAMAQDQQAWQMAMAVLDGLPASQREAYWLTEIEGLTAAQAGGALGVSANTISSRLRTARQALARHGEVMRARDAGELERALRRETSPSARQRSSALAGLAVQLSALAKAAAPVLGGLGVWAAAAAATIAVAIGVAATGEDPAPPRGPQRPSVAAAPPEAPADPPQPIVAAVAPAEAKASPLPAVKEPAVVAPRRATKRVRSTDASLAEEAKLVRDIKAAVVRNPSEALSLAQQHARRFPAGVLAQEASSLRVQALCGLGRAEDARAAKALPAGHTWSPGCPREENPTNPEAAGEEGGI